MSQEGTHVSCITGEIFVKEGTSKKRVVRSLKLNGTVNVEASTNSYADISDNPSPDSGKQASGLTLFPNGKVIVKVKRGYIEEVEISKGLVMVSLAPRKRILTPVAEFSGMAWVDVSSDGITVVANSRETIYNRKTRRTVILQGNQQVLITEDNIGDPEPMDQRFYQAQKTWENLGAFYGASMYQQVAEKSDALLEASLMALKSLAEKTGQNFGKLKEEAIQEHQKYKQWAISEAEKCREDAENIKKTDFVPAHIIPINQSIKYQSIELKILSIKRDSKSKDADLLSIQIEAKNESENQVFVFWNEEARVINEKGEVFSIDNYNLETSFMGNTQANGYLFIPVNKQDQKFTLQFGKKSLPKTDLDLDLSKNIQGGE